MSRQKLCGFEALGARCFLPVSSFRCPQGEQLSFFRSSFAQEGMTTCCVAPKKNDVFWGPLSDNLLFQKADAFCDAKLSDEGDRAGDGLMLEGVCGEPPGRSLAFIFSGPGSVAAKRWFSPPYPVTGAAVSHQKCFKRSNDKRYTNASRIGKSVLDHLAWLCHEGWQNESGGARSSICRRNNMLLEP